MRRRPNEDPQPASAFSPRPIGDLKQVLSGSRADIERHRILRQPLVMEFLRHPPVQDLMQRYLVITGLSTAAESLRQAVTGCQTLSPAPDTVREAEQVVFRLWEGSLGLLLGALNAIIRDLLGSPVPWLAGESAHFCYMRLYQFACGDRVHVQWTMQPLTPIHTPFTVDMDQTATAAERRRQARQAVRAALAASGTVDRTLRGRMPSAKKLQEYQTWSHWYWRHVALKVPIRALARESHDQCCQNVDHMACDWHHKVEYGLDRVADKLTLPPRPGRR